MASVNKVILVGNIGKDPEIRYLPDGRAVASVSLATSSNWKDKSTGERREETEWHRLSFFDRLAEIVGEYGKKGNSIYAEGRLKTRKWQDKDGQDRYTTEIIVEQMQLLGGKRDSSQSSGENNQDFDGANSGGGSSRNKVLSSSRSNSSSSSSGSVMDLDDDIPF